MMGTEHGAGGPPARAGASRSRARAEPVLSAAKECPRYQRWYQWNKSGAKAARLRRHTIQVWAPGVSMSVC